MIEVSRITSLLQDVSAGRDGAMDELMSEVYADLQGVAHRHMRERFGDGMDRLTLEPAALVNESFLRLLKQRQGFENRHQFFAIATRVMIRVLMDYCRQRSAAKRGGRLGRVSISFNDAVAPLDPPDHTGQIDLDSLTSALETLESLDSRKADVVRMRVIWGLQNDEIAEALDVSIPTVERDWRFARAWLADAVAMGAGPPDPGSSAS